MLLLATHAYAHTGIDPHNGWMHGLMHPLAELDHVLAMIAVGLWAAQTGGRAIWGCTADFRNCYGTRLIFGDNNACAYFY